VNHLSTKDANGKPVLKAFGKGMDTAREWTTIALVGLSDAKQKGFGRRPQKSGTDAAGSAALLSIIDPKGIHLPLPPLCKYS
jgi:hypothetical protein